MLRKYCFLLTQQRYVRVPHAPALSVRAFAALSCVFSTRMLQRVDHVC